MRFQPGDTVGPYRVTGLIGEGANGVVYQVVNSVTGRLEAVKVLADSLIGDREQAQRFLREIQLQAKLDHPNIAQVRTAFCEGATIVLVMELVDGESLNAVLRRGPLSVAGAIRIAEQVLSALIMAHHLGVIHRDVKPANILVDRQGNAKLTDFGLAKQYGEPGQTSQGLAVGTVYYMAPEQVRGLAATDWRADLYAVGVLLYEMLTGRKPFDGNEQYAVMRAHVESVPPPVSRWAPYLPKEFDALIERALEKDPERRFQSAAGFLTALQELPVTTPPPTRGYMNFATYAVGIGALAVAAFAIPPTIWEPSLDTIPMRMPSPPAVPADALVRPVPSTEPAVPTADAAEPPAAAAQRQVRRAAPPVTKPPAAKSAPVPFGATRINSTEPVLAAEPPPVKTAAPATPTAALPPPPRLNVPAPPPQEPLPTAKPELPTERPANWMRRNLGKIPRIFRRRDAETQPKQ